LPRLALPVEFLQYRLNMSDIIIKLTKIGVGIPKCIA
jgi:hypothetical protein